MATFTNNDINGINYLLGELVFIHDPKEARIAVNSLCDYLNRVPHIHAYTHRGGLYIAECVNEQYGFKDAEEFVGKNAIIEALEERFDSVFEFGF